MMRSGDRGFTLPETLVAGLLMMLVVLPLMPMYSRSLRFIDLMNSRFKLNEQAREVFFVLSDGVRNHSGWGSSSSRGFNLIEGLRSRASAPLGSSLRSGQQFQFTDGTLSILGDSVPTLSIACTAAATPVLDCVSTETRTVNGWVGGNPIITASAPFVDVAVPLTDAYRAQRGRLPASSLTEQYRMMFTLGVESNP